MKNKNEATLAFRIDDDTKNRLEAAAEKSNLSVSALIRVFLTNFLEDVESGKAKVELKLIYPEQTSTHMKAAESPAEYSNGKKRT